jgi:hypothetical protein
MPWEDGVRRKSSKKKTVDHLDRTKALQESLQHLMDEARQIRAMVEKLNAGDNVRELRRLLKQKEQPPWKADDRPPRSKTCLN